MIRGCVVFDHFVGKKGLKGRERKWGGVKFNSTFLDFMISYLTLSFKVYILSLDS